jgi:hypothetical protein
MGISAVGTGAEVVHSTSTLEAMMRTPFLFLTLLILATSPCSALTKQAADFLKSAGLDPADADVIAADQDGVIEATYAGDPVTFGLESLAIGKKTNAVRTFVTTRKMIRELKTDFKGYEMPPGGVPGSDVLYLTTAERLLLSKMLDEAK